MLLPSNSCFVDPRLGLTHPASSREWHISFTVTPSSLANSIPSCRTGIRSRSCKIPRTGMLIVSAWPPQAAISQTPPSSGPPPLLLLKTFNRPWTTCRRSSIDFRTNRTGIGSFSTFCRRGMIRYLWRKRFALSRSTPRGLAANSVDCRVMLCSESTSFCTMPQIS